MPTVLTSFEGPAYGAGTPPDPAGDVGPNHYIAAVNTKVGIYSKTGTLLASFTFNSLWSGVGSSLCNGYNRGDPTVVYDPVGDRWIVADFAFTDPAFPPYYECIAVSKTGDPVTGGWWYWVLRGDDATHPWLPDYPKMSVWSDSLLMTANMFSGGSSFQGVRLWAMNLSDLEAGGGSARLLVHDLSSSYSSVLPANVRGAAPPAGSAAYLVAQDLNAYKFDVWKWSINWGTVTGTLTGPTQVSQNSYLVPSGDAVPQPGTLQRLDALGDRLMMQAQYRNISGIESLWVAHTAGTSSPAVTGIQWAQLNVTGGSISASPVQQGIWNGGGDGLWRFIPSLAVDRAGNMAVAYSVSSSTTYPSLRYVGRLNSDPLGTLGQGESVILAGSASQTYSGRWGDYFSMSVDPVDDCTFWFVGEYLSPSTLRWSTRIASFAFPSCGNASGLLVSSFTPSAGGAGSSITLTGSGFATPATCRVNTSVATVCAVLNPTTVVTAVPAGASTGTLKVTVGGVTATSSTSFTVGSMVAPAVSSFSPTSGGVGTVLTITGSNVASATSVKVGSVTLTSGWTVLSATQISVPIPPTATSGSVAVTTAGGTGTASGTLTIYAAPSISSVSPASQIAGLSTSITGSGFLGTTSVSFNGVSAASFSVVSSTSITAYVPSGATAGPVTVTNPAGSASSGTFTPLRYIASAAAAGTSHSCALVADGTIRCWGLNSNGQLGDGSTTRRGTSQAVLGLSGATAVSAGGAFSCAVVNGGASGTAKCWGQNTNGQLGDGTTSQRTTPVTVLASAGTPLTGVRQLANGNSHSCALLYSGEVRCWGLNSSGQLGDGTTTQRAYPVVTTISGTTPLAGVVQIAARGSETCALLTTGAVRCWGLNTNGQIGDGTTTNRTRPTQVSGLSAGVAQVTVGGSHACAVMSTTQVRCWGLNSSRQLADGTTTQRTTPVTVLVAAGTVMSGVSSMVSGVAFNCALMTDQTLRCWGANASGQLGSGTTTTPTYPVSVKGVGAVGTFASAVAAAAGGAHVIALAGGQLFAWGLNSYGQLGDNTTTQRTAPVAILGF